MASHYVTQALNRAITGNDRLRALLEQNAMSNLSEDPAAWLKSQFEFEYCAECGGDAQHHTATPFMGNWFARCDFPPDDATGDFHPVVARFRCEAA